MRFTLAMTLTMAMMAVACSLLTDLNDLGTDAGSDALPDVSPNGYSFTLSPSAVALNDGDLPVTITINVVRGASFTDLISFTVTGQPIGITSTPPPPAANGQTTSSFQLAIAGAQQGQYEVVVTGTSGNLVEQAKLPLYVDTTLTPDDAGVVIVPPWAGTLDVKAWGGGGGGGGQGTGPDTTVGAAGGGGGFASATFPATPGSKWTLVAGTGGASCKGSSCGGGGGGGFSGVMDPIGSWMLIAGAGGGGASANAGSTQAGGGGGGATGQDALGTSCPAKGGTQSAGGAGAVDGCTGPGHGSNGTAFNGGTAGTFLEGGGGGVPGGGAPSGPSSSWIGGAGGGGGGRFGGGGGVFTGGNSVATGGGGGSGFVDLTGTNAVNDPAAGAVCANGSDPDLKTPCTGGTSGVAGSNGLVIVRAKP